MSHHAHAELYYHFVWSTKDFEKVLAVEWEGRLHAYLDAKCRGYGYVPIAIGSADDHMHVLLRAQPDLAPSEIAGKIKGSSSRFVNVNQLVSPKLEWQNGYGVFSVSPWAVRTVARYVRRQRLRHRTRMLDPALEPASAGFAATPAGTVFTPSATRVPGREGSDAPR